MFCVLTFVFGFDSSVLQNHSPSPSRKPLAARLKNDFSSIQPLENLIKRVWARFYSISFKTQIKP
jgi:hypothetical protein